MKLELTDDQALVLFEWLSRIDESEAMSYEHDAERQVLWAVHGQLEKALAQPFRQEYKSLLDGARSRITGRSNS
jgi:hypothetical protein